MKSKLADKLKAAKSNIKKNIKNNLDVQSSFNVLTDDEIALVLAHRAKQTRLKHNLKQKELGELAQLSSPTTYSNFEQSGKISLVNFIKVFRAFGKLSELELLLKESVTQKIETLSQEKSSVRKRVR